jgi:hypothetical protein
MRKHFLMGLDSVSIFKKEGVQALLDCKDNYSIITIDDEKDNLVEIMHKVVGWDGFVELLSQELMAIEYEKNRRQWREFLNMLDPDDGMSDGEILDYISTFYRVPEFIHFKK